MLVGREIFISGQGPDRWPYKRTIDEAVVNPVELSCSAAAFLRMERNIMIALVTTASSTAIIAFSTGFHAIQHWKQVFSKRKDGYEEITTDLYEDEDGIATVESEAKYSTFAQKGFIILGTLLGFGFSLSVAIRSTGDRTSSGYISNWLVFVSWVYHSVLKNILR